MKLLVTGGAGYIGSVVSRQLLEAGHEVVVLDDLSTGHADAVPAGAEFVERGLHDAASVITSAAAFDGVVHFAAKALVAESVAHPERYWENNVGGSLALLEAMRTAEVPRLVFSSTCATYGQPDVSPIDEDAPTRPATSYGASKLAVDHMISSYATGHGLGAVSLRYFNVGGAFGGAGERHATETHLVPLALQVATGERPLLQVFGDDYATHDGTCIRDYIHVADLGRAHLLALDAIEPGEHTIVNLGTGTGYTVLQVIEAVRSVTGHPLPTEVASRRPGDPAALVAANAKAAGHLGWRPEKSLEDVVRDAWEFVQGEGVQRVRASRVRARGSLGPAARQPESS